MGTDTQEIVIAKARIPDAPRIHRLVTYWSERTPVLPKSLGQIYEDLREFVVAREGDRVVGAAAMHIDWSDLAEIRTVVVHPERQKRGIGKRMIEALIEEACQLGIDRVFILTDQAEWFARFGFQVIEKDELPHKVWRDCVHCPIFTHCTEIAMARPARMEKKD